MDDAIVVEGLYKRFRRYHPHRPFTLQEVFQRGLQRIAPVDYFWALDDVSFSVEAGGTIGSLAPMERVNPLCSASLAVSDFRTGDAFVWRGSSVRY